MTQVPIIDQTISTVAPVLRRDTINPTIPATQDAFVQSAEAFFDKISDTTVNEINQVTTKIDTTVAAINTVAQEISEAATIAIASGKYKGNWIPNFETTGYSLGDGVTFSDGYNYVSKINNNLTTPITLTNTDQWNFIEAVNPNNYYLKTEADNLYIALSGDQTISGNKSFTNKISSLNIVYKDTPISISSWSYMTTTITLNVASHTFVTGDHIEVSGLTATTYPANGIHLVTSVTSTTIVFTLSVTPTGTAGVSSATVKGYATVNGRVSESIGVNQTWQNVTADRALNTTYINSTGKPIVITATISGDGPGTTTAKGLVNGVEIIRSWASYITSGTATGAMITFIVPIGGTYLVDLVPSGPTQTLYSWSELK